MLHYSISDIHTSLVKLVKGCKVCHQVRYYLSSQRLTEVDATSHTTINQYTYACIHTYNTCKYNVMTQILYAY